MLIDPVSRDARWPGGQERLQPQIVKVLSILAGRRGDVVTRDELIQLCWDGRIVGDDVINRAISLLRHLSERAGGFAIETVPRTGYRLIETESAIRSRFGIWAIAAAVALVLGLGGLIGWTWFGQQPVKQGIPPVPTIMIVPFSAAANDPQIRQIAQAAPISLAHKLSESGFAIIRADSATDQSTPSDYVFSGNVRRTATSVEATVQMVSRRDGTIAFAHDFSAPPERAADLPDRIGATAAAELAWTGAEMVLDPREHLTPEITSELMKSINLTIEQGDSIRAYQLARHGASLAPNSAIAQLDLAVITGFALDSIPRNEREEAIATGRRASDRARALAPEFGDVYIPWCLLRSPVRRADCETRLRYAGRIDSSSSFVPGYLSAILADAGKVDESVQLAGVSMANDPYKPAKLARMGRMFEEAGRADDADRIYRQAIRLWPDETRIRASRLLGMAEGGNYSGLERFVDPNLDQQMLDPKPLSSLLAAERMHDLPSAERACAANGLKVFTLRLCMIILANLGDLDRSFSIASGLYPPWVAAPGTDEDRLWLDHPDGYATAILTGPAGRAMRSDPRFLGIARSEGLLEFWTKKGMPDFCTKTYEPECAKIAAH